MNQTTIACIALASFFSSPLLVCSEESLSPRALDMKKTLKGNGKMRGYKSIDPNAGNKIRDFYISLAEADKRRGITSFFEGDYTSVDRIIAPMSNPNLGSVGDLSIVSGSQAYKVSYRIDLSSKLTGEIHFAKGSARIVDPGTHAYLKDFASVLNNAEMKGLKFVIEGHASAEGSTVRNKELSMNRASAIYEHLVHTHHVDPKQIYALGYGEDEARYRAQSPESELAKDRRVLIYKLVSLRPIPTSGKDSRPKDSSSSKLSDTESKGKGTKTSL